MGVEPAATGGSSKMQGTVQLLPPSRLIKESVPRSSEPGLLST